MTKREMIGIGVAALFLALSSPAKGDEKTWVTIAEGETPLTLSLRGYYLREKGRYAEAIVFLRRVLKIEPENVFARNQLALSLVRMARREFGYVLNIEPDNPFATRWMEVLK